MNIFREFRYAFRRLWKSPAIFVTGVITLTLAIGIGTVIFTWVNAFLLRPLPIENPGEVLMVLPGRGQSLSFPNYIDIRDRNEVFSELAATRIAPMNLSQRSGNARVWGYLVTGNYFELLGINALYGRLLNVNDDIETGEHPVAVISYNSWQRHLGADPAIVGKTIRLNSHTFTIVGVTPPGFFGTDLVLNSDIWVPFSMIREIENRDWRSARRTSNAFVFGRLRSGTTPAQAQTSLQLVADGMAREYPDINEGLRFRLVTPGLFGQEGRVMVMGMGSILLTLAILTLIVACANLSGLLLAQGADRRRELAIRLAMGARRAGLVQMLLTEVLIIAALGGLFGFILSRWVAQIITVSMPALEIPMVVDLSPDWRVFAFTAVTALFSGVVFGLLPALRISSIDVAPVLKNEPGSEAFRRVHLRDLYVAIQVAMAVFLLTCSIIMTRTAQEALNVDLGFEPDDGVALRFDVGMHGYTAERGRDFQLQVLDRVRKLPGIQAASIATSIPFSIDQSTNTVFAEGAAIPKPSEAESATTYGAHPDLFHALGVSLISGRDFTDRDRADSQLVAIVNEAFAERLYPRQNALGKRFRTGPAGPLYEIVGIVETGKYRTLTEEARPVFWLPLEQRYNSTSVLVVRTSLGDGALPLLRKTVADLDPEVVVYDAKGLRGFLDLAVGPYLFVSTSLRAMGFLAAFLVAIGISGLIAYSVARRTREIGIRRALGATKVDVLRSVLMRILILVTVSCGLGLVVSIASSRLFSQFLLHTPSIWTYVLGIGIVCSISAAACVVPVRRAMLVEPSSALRHE